MAGSQVTYPEVFEGVDLVVSVHEDGTGFSEVLRVESPQAAANPALASLSFPVQTTEGLRVVSDEGGFVARDGAGEEVFTSPTPLMWDSAADELTGGVGAPGVLAPLAPQSLRTSGTASLGASLFALPPTVAGTEPESGVGAGDPVQAPREGDEVAAMPAVVEPDAVTITPDVEMIADPETVWPIYIDPSVSGSRNEWTLIRSAVPNTVAGYRFGGDAGLGLCDPNATSACSKYNDVHRLVWGFGGYGSFGAPNGSDVISATFSVYGTHSWSCSATNTQLWYTGMMSAGTTWNNLGWGAQTGSATVAHKPSCAGQSDRWIEFDATAGARALAAFGGGTLTMGLKAADEGSMAGGWKRYRFDSHLSVTYDRPPSAPTNVWISNPDTPGCVVGAGRPYIRSTTPTMHWTVGDPDGTNVIGNLDIVDLAAPGFAWDAPEDTAMASGSTHSRTVPKGKLLDGHTYQWRAGGLDPVTSRYGPMSACEFTIDTTPPPPPLITIATGGTAAYLENQIAGGIGQLGRFTLGSDGDLTIVGYKYSFNSDALDNYVGIGNWYAADISFTPTSVGSQRLVVQAVDRAGNTSPVRTYRFSVKFVGASAMWRLDEGAGPSASSVVGGKSLAVSPSTQWVDGVFADFGVNSADKALRFDNVLDTAQTTGPVLDTSGSFTVMSTVKLEDDSTVRVAVSQDGQRFGAFKLGHLPKEYCGGRPDSCWGFWMSSDDSAGVPVFATSALPVKKNSWVHLTGVRDAVNGTIRLYVCEVGTPAEPGSTEPVLAATTPFKPSVKWSAGGPLQLGRSLVDARHSEGWIGAIDDVRAYDSIVPVETIRRACQKTDV
ncbi:LamG domain-containing protein [Oerskovia sp. KBS0722]|uniref:LamG domain-containing protein n=1 Tax=Oerskovia sp. KBS0722 TaxID=1179673 RepID=UPI00143CD3A8|nr:LamG domain-containing protein [Oerskovia sp. KBS0722]